MQSAFGRPRIISIANGSLTLNPVARYISPVIAGSPRFKIQSKLFKVYVKFDKLGVRLNIWLTTFAQSGMQLLSWPNNNLIQAEDLDLHASDTLAHSN